MDTQRAGIILLRKYAEVIAEMSAEDAGHLLKAVYAYDAGEDIPSMPPFARAVFLTIRADLDEHASRYAQVCERNRQNAKKRWQKEPAGAAADSFGGMRPDTAVYDAVRSHAGACEAVPEETVACESCQEKRREGNRREKKKNIYMQAGTQKAGAERSTKSDNVYPMMTGEERAQFEKFWQLYPRRESRVRAEAAWRELSPDTELAGKILAAVQSACIADPRFQTRQYTPHPATWLQNREWENQYETKQTEDINYGSWTTD